MRGTLRRSLFAVGVGAFCLALFTGTSNLTSVLYFFYAALTSLFAERFFAPFAVAYVHIF